MARVATGVAIGRIVVAEVVGLVILDLTTVGLITAVESFFVCCSSSFNNVVAFDKSPI